MTADRSVRVLHVKGDHYQLGLQHGQQVQDLRSDIVRAMEARFSQLEVDGADDQFQMMVIETENVLRAIDPAIVAMVQGLAAGLALSFEQLLRYNLVAFLRDALTTRRSADGSAPQSGATQTKLPLRLIQPAAPGQESGLPPG